MRLSDILKPSAVRVTSESRDKPTVIRELVALAGSDVLNAEQVSQAVLERETSKTTGIGNAVAVPHAKTAAVKKLVMSVAVAKTPIDFGAADGRPASLVILLVGPPDQTGPYIQALARIAKLMCMDGLRRRVLEAATGEAAYKILIEEEAHLLKC